MLTDGLIILALGYQAAVSPALQRNYTHSVANWPAGAPVVRLLLISDLHLVEPDTPPSRIAALVTRINALKPDCVLIAGDLISDKVLSTRHLDPYSTTFAQRGRSQKTADEERSAVA